MLRVQVSRRPHWRGILATGKRGSTKPAGSTWNIWDGDGSNLLSSHLPAAGSLVVCDGVDALGAAREESGLFSSTHVGDGKKSDKQREQHQQAENPSQQAHEGNPGTVCPAYPSLIGNCVVVLASVLHGARQVAPASPDASLRLNRFAVRGNSKKWKTLVNRRGRPDLSAAAMGHRDDPIFS